MAYKGTFKPSKPEKYKGDPTRIVYRSSWERKLMLYLDQHPDIIEWASEETIVPYISPIDGRRHRYFPDFVVKKKDNSGNIQIIMIEVKPAIQTIAPKVLSKPTRRYLKEVSTYGINMAKWAAAEKFCEERGWIFQKMTEKHLGIK
jgi:hypothetical protein